VVNSKSEVVNKGWEKAQQQGDQQNVAQPPEVKPSSEEDAVQ
jgi:hypothetical protein